jgi:predicted transglutaminase-like cysteine proteinase
MKKTIKNYISVSVLLTTAFFHSYSVNSKELTESVKFERIITSQSTPAWLRATVSNSTDWLNRSLSALSVETASIWRDAQNANIRTNTIPAPAISPEMARSPKPQATAPNAVFGTVAFPLRRLGALTKFAPSFNQIVDGSSWACENGKCNAATLAVKAASSRVVQSSLRDKLNDINATVNTAIRYSSDADNYNVADRWAKPSETLDRQAGDCEDFAILKMAALLASGVSMDDMAIVVLFDQKRHFYHAVLSVSAGGKYYILDNMRNDVRTDDQLPNYVPLYSIANNHGYFHGLPVSRSNQVAGTMLPFEKVAPGEGAPL